MSDPTFILEIQDIYPLKQECTGPKGQGHWTTLMGRPLIKTMKDNKK